MPVTHEIMARAGTYTDREGNEKTRWQKCGIMIEKDGKLSIKLEALPVTFDGWLSCFEPRQDERQQRQAPARKRAADKSSDSFDDMNDEIPF